MPDAPQTPPTSYGFVRLILARPFIDEVERRGIKTERVIQSLGLAPEDLNDPERFVHAQTVYGLFNALADAAGDPQLGYHVGSRLDFAKWPPFQRAVNSSRTVGEFLTAFIEAVPSEANSVRHELTITSQGACYRIHRLIETGASPQHTEAFGVSHFVRLFQSISGKQWKPDDVMIRTQFTAALPTRVQGVKVERKGEGGLEIHFPTSWLYAAIELSSVLSAAHGRAQKGLGRDVSLISVFQAAARTMLHDLGAGVDDIAKAVGVDSADLKTALHNEGTTAAKEFRRLRLETAKARLGSSNSSISELAGDLGYSDPAHFTRFFRTQTGHSPRTYRKTQLGRK